MGCGGSTESCTEKQQPQAVARPVKEHVQSTELEATISSDLHPVTATPRDTEVETSYMRRYKTCTDNLLLASEEQRWAQMSGEQEKEASETASALSETTSEPLSDTTNEQSPSKVSKRPSTPSVEEDAGPHESPSAPLEFGCSAEQVVVGTEADTPAALTEPKPKPDNTKHEPDVKVLYKNVQRVRDEAERLEMLQKPTQASRQSAEAPECLCPSLLLKASAANVAQSAECVESWSD